MAFEWDPADRAAFRVALIDHLTAAFPGALISWGEYDRRLIVTFPDGRASSIWEPNFYFSRGDYYSDATLLAQAAAAIGAGVAS